MTTTKRAELVEQRIYDRCLVRVGQLEAEKAALEARIDELCTEVERLRAANTDFTGRSIRAGDKMACLEAENAKLQKLVSVMDYCMQYERECDECALNGGSNTITEYAGCDGLHEMLRELGIEASE